MTNKLPVGKRQTLEEVMDKCDNPDLWTPSQIICFISDYLDGSIGEELPEDNQTDRVAKVKNLVQDGCQHNSDLKVWLKAHPDCIQTIRENRTVGLSKEVLEAMEELREVVSPSTEFATCIENEYYKYVNASKNLLNVLDNQFNSTKVEEDCPNEQAALNWNTEELVEESSPKSCECNHKVESCPDCVVEEEPAKDIDVSTKSIWKPVSELSNRCNDILVKFTHHNTITLCHSFNGYIGIGEQEVEKSLIKEFCTLTDFINQHNSLLDRVERLEKIIGDKII